MSAPTQPGWWWRKKPSGAIEAVEVLPYGTSALMWGPRRYTVTGSASEGWLCEVPTPERIATDAERLERVTQMLATDIPEASAMFEHSRSEYDRGVHNGLVMVRSVLNGDES